MNQGRVVVLSVLGTLLLVFVAAGAFWLGTQANDAADPINDQEAAEPSPPSTTASTEVEPSIAGAATTEPILAPTAQPDGRLYDDLGHDAYVAAQVRLGEITALAADCVWDVAASAGLTPYVESVLPEDLEFEVSPSSAMDDAAAENFWAVIAAC